MKKNKNTDVDVVVIGSGVGGLSCAAVLGMFGKKVLVLERNSPEECRYTQTVILNGETKQIPIPTAVGGCMQPITYDKWRWNLGLQYQAPFSCYVGPFYLHEAGIIPLMTDPPVRLRDLDEDYQRLSFPDLGEDATYKIYSNGEKMKASLIEQFPSQTSGITKYFEYVDTTDKYTYPLMVAKVLPPFWSRFLFPELTEKLKPLIDQNYDEVVDALFDDSDEGTRVRAVLDAYWNVLGMPPNTNFLFWTMSDNQLFHGISVPEGGSESLVNGLLGTIRKNGGALRTGPEGTVEEICVNGRLCRKVTGVRLSNGETIHADVVISTAGLPDTIGPLIKEKAVSRRVRTSLKEHISIPSSLILRIGLDLDRDGLAAHGVVEKKTYRRITGSPWTFSTDPTADGWVPDDIMVLFPRFYDTDPGDPALQTVEVVHITDYQKYFAKYTGPDDPAFKDAETRIISVLRSHFEKTFPSLAPHIACMMLTSPLILKEQIRHTEASMYGIDAYRTIDPAIQSRTGLRGFYLSGEDTFVNGVTVATGIITAACVMIDTYLREAPHILLKYMGYMPRLIIDYIKGNPRVKLPDAVRKMLTSR